MFDDTYMLVLLRHHVQNNNKFGVVCRKTAERQYNGKKFQIQKKKITSVSNHRSLYFVNYKCYVRFSFASDFVVNFLRSNGGALTTNTININT